MGAELMRAAGQGFEREPRDFAAGVRDGAIEGEGALSVVVGHDVKGDGGHAGELDHLVQRCLVVVDHHAFVFKALAVEKLLLGVAESTGLGGIDLHTYEQL